LFAYLLFIFEEEETFEVKKNTRRVTPKVTLILSLGVNKGQLLINTCYEAEKK